jgi:DNA-directed RNA polymerase specialized sigma subunit
MQLSSLTDAELAERVVKGDGDAFAELADRYRWLIGWLTHRPHPGLEREDERQEALIGLLQACRDFDPARGSFGAIATIRVRSRVSTARAKAHNTRNRIITNALRLETTPASTRTACARSARCCRRATRAIR